MSRKNPSEIPLILDSRTVANLLRGDAGRLVLPGTRGQHPGHPAGGYPANRKVADTGEYLWVKEAWMQGNPHGTYAPGMTVFYKADYLDDSWAADEIDGKWLPATTMPRAVCRLQLCVRRFAVIPISEALRLEGYANRHLLTATSSPLAQMSLFDSDPKVWSVEFERVPVNAEATA